MARKKNYLQQRNDIEDALADAVGNGDECVTVYDKDLDVLLKQFATMYSKLSKLYYNDEAIFSESN